MIDFISIINTFDKTSKRKEFWRYLIEENKLVCPATNKIVKYCSYDKLISKNKKITYHFNFYSEDGELFTIDHKIPKYIGGMDNITNIQPMIWYENIKKGSNLIYTN